MTTPKKAKKSNRANFGSVRQLASGRWQARYPAEDGAPSKAPLTFDTAAAAWEYISQVRADRSRGTYTDPKKGERLLSDFADEWISNGGSRGKLAVRTTELYRDILAREITPTIGGKPIGKVTPAMVRSWHTALGQDLAKRTEKRADGSQRAATGSARQRQAYAFLKSILATAEADGLIGKNPARIVGAGVARSPERPFMDVATFALIMSHMPDDLQAPLALTFGAHLRVGELVALRRGDLDVKAATLTVERQEIAARTGAVITKTKTGTTRKVDLPQVTIDAMDDYLATVPKAMPSAALFVRKDGTPITRANMQQNFAKARTAAGFPMFHLHDVRHSGLTLGAQSGATVRELMKRAGHKTTAAAMAYQHAAEERGAVIASGMNAAMGGLAKKA